MLISNTIDLDFLQYIRPDLVTYETYKAREIISLAVIRSLTITTSMIKNIEVTVAQKI